MKNLMQFTLALTLLTLLTACAQPAYRSANGNGFGYTQQQLTQDQYRINFKARGDDTGKAMDYALLRASELALENDYEWFTVNDRQILVDRERVADYSEVGVGVGFETVQSCGLLSCRSYRRPVTQYQTNVFLGDRRSEVEVALEVLMGNGRMPANGESFDASEVFKNLKPE